MDERYQFVFFLRQDRQYKLQDEYQRRCDKRGSDPQLYRLVCSQCLIIHDPCHFSAGQIGLNTSPKSRICAGLEGFIELCEHFSWSAECLWRGIRVVEGLELRCSFEHSHDIHGNIINQIGMPMLNPILRYLPEGIISMYRAFPLFTIGHEIATHEALSTALRTLNGYICPHLRTGSPELFGGQVLTAECTGSIVVPKPLLRGCDFFELGICLREGGCMFWSVCWNPNCLTRYGLRRVQLYTRPETDLVVFEVYSRMLNGPTHTSWQAQVLRGCSEEEDTIEINKRRRSKPADCDAQLWACRGLFCAGRYKSRIVKP